MYWIFLCLHQPEKRGSGSIIQGCQEADPWYPFQTAIQSVLKLTGQDVFDQTQTHDDFFRRYPL